MIEKTYVCKLIKQYYTENEKNYSEEYVSEPSRINVIFLAREKENRNAVTEAMKRFVTKYGDMGPVYLRLIKEYFWKRRKSVVSLSMECGLSQSAVYAVIRDFIGMTASELGIRLERIRSEQRR